jgi:hypothetical protein
MTFILLLDRSVNCCVNPKEEGLEFSNSKTLGNLWDLMKSLLESIEVQQNAGISGYPRKPIG